MAADLGLFPKYTEIQKTLDHFPKNPTDKGCVGGAVKTFCILMLSATVTLPQIARAEGTVSDRPAEWQVFVSSTTSVFQWRVNPRNHKLNFRRCDLKLEGVVLWSCRDPMMQTGMDPMELLFLLNFYVESLSRTSGHVQKWIYGLAAGSLAGLGGYVGYLSVLNTISESLPEHIRPLVRRGYHGLIAGGLLVILYFTWQNIQSHRRQAVILEEFQRAIEAQPEVPPEIHLDSQTIFEEFMLSFQTALLAFLQKRTETGAYYILQ